MTALDRRAFLGAAASSLVVGPLAARHAEWMGQAASAGRPEVGRWRTHFPALTQLVNGHPLAYLDSAATTLRPRAVIDAVTTYYETDNANPGATLHTLAKRSASRLGAARARVARFLGAADPAEVVFTRGTTEAINLVAATWGEANITAGDEIVLTVAEHYSNLLPWRRLAARVGARVVVVDVTDDGRIDPARVREACTSRTKLLAFSHVSNVLGLINPAHELCALARERDIRVLVDAAQSAPHVSLDVKALGCDFLACSSHKMLGPMGLGVLWARAELLEAMPPYHVGSNMAHDVTEATFALEHGAAKYQAGTPNVSGPIGLAAALDELDQLGMPAVAQHDRNLVAYARERLAPLRGVRILGTLSADVPRVPVFTFVKERVSPAALVAALDEAGVAVRAGDMAALPLLARFGVESAVRASCYVYTTSEELDRLAQVVERVGR
jgi:cysteine desulfurase / selenocysteine lyase